jgi:hypothetical protein
MLCKVCHNEILNKVKIKNGYICQSCYDKLPESVKANVDNFTIKQIKQIQDLFQDVEETSLANCGTFRVCKNAIQINGKEIKLKNLRGIRLNFHPNAYGMSAGTAVGILTVVIDTKSPHYMFEEPFYPKEVTASYVISGKNVTYGYSYTIEKLFKTIQKCIDEKSYNMADYMAEYQNAVNQNFAKESKKENKKENKNVNSNNSANQRKKEEDMHRERNTQNSQTNTNNTNNTSNSTKNKPKTPFEEAKYLYNIELPYTEKQLKKIRNDLLKKYHPDMGGSDEMCIKINEAYTLLLKFVS